MPSVVLCISRSTSGLEAVTSLEQGDALLLLRDVICDATNDVLGDEDAEADADVVIAGVDDVMGLWGLGDVVDAGSGAGTLRGGTGSGDDVITGSGDGSCKLIGGMPSGNAI